MHRTDRQIHDLQRRVDARSASIARRFDRIAEVLTELGYLADDAATASGRTLMRLYTESDLLAAQALGDWAGLRPEALAAVCCALVYEARSGDTDAPPPLGDAAVREAIGGLIQRYEDLREVEARHGLAITRRPDPGLVEATLRWARGASLIDVLTRADITAGDFVRWMRQVIDLLGQVQAAVEPGSPLRAAAGEAARLLDRGVVAYSSAG
jgi:ATP-dependent RNA helicase HelY